MLFPTKPFSQTHNNNTNGLWWWPTAKKKKKEKISGGGPNRVSEFQIGFDVVVVVEI